MEDVCGMRYNLETTAGTIVIEVRIRFLTASKLSQMMEVPAPPGSSRPPASNLSMIRRCAGPSASQSASRRRRRRDWRRDFFDFLIFFV